MSGKATETGLGRKSRAFRAETKTENKIKKIGCLEAHSWCVYKSAVVESLSEKGEYFLPSFQPHK